MTGRLQSAILVAMAMTALVLVAACASSGGGPSIATQSPSPSNSSLSATDSPPPSGSAVSPTSASSPSSSPRSSNPSTSTVAPTVVLAQAWATAPLVDVSTGESFRIADHAGKVILIETMAIWCSNCRAQQGDVKAALGRLPADSVVYIVLDVDPNEDGPSLATYRERNGFEGHYAIAGSEVARALAAEFGDLFLNPPATPIAIIGTDGRVTLTEYGHKSPDELVALAEAHGA